MRMLMNTYQLPGRNKQCSVPDLYFKRFCSEKPHSSQASWVTCQFSPDVSNEHLLLVGDQDGQFFLVDVRYSNSDTDRKFVRHGIRADESCILELEFVPSRPHQVISLSGHSNVRLWDFEKGTNVYEFKGHEGSVRALAVSEFNPDIFVTGSRDGVICQWDQRVNPNASGLRFPSNFIDNTHSSAFSQRVINRQRQRSVSKSSTSGGITSLIQLDENIVVSSSTSFKTGIRLWDMRYRRKNNHTPLRVLEIPQTRNARDFGVASLCVDRYRSSLFAACTDSCVYEYAINSSRKLPVSALSGVPRMEFYAFDLRLAASPISDHLLFGSGDKFGLIWDFQEHRRGLLIQQDDATNYFPYPKFTLGGHQTEVRIVRMSSSGNYIVSMDDTQWRLWKPDANLAESAPSPVGFERVEYFKLPETVLDSQRMTQLSVQSAGSQKIRKRKLTSPFVSPSKPLVPFEKFSPVAKIFKRLSPLSPITNTLVESSRSGLARRKLEFGGEGAGIEVVPEKIIYKSFFHSKYPTLDLPDFVREKEIRKLKENLEPVISPLIIKKRGSKGTMEDFVTLGKPLSNCSKMVKALERKIDRSPRKLVLKRRLQESAKIAAERYTPKTPHQEKRGRNRGSSTADETPSKHRTETDTAKRKRRSGRTLNDFFNKKA